MNLFFIFFIVIFFSIYILTHCYLYLSVVKIFHFSWKQKRILRFIVIVLALPFLLDRLLGGFFFFYPLSYFGVHWFGYMVLLAFLFILKDIAGLFFKQKRKILTVAAFLMSIVFAGFGFYGAVKSVPVKKIEIESAFFPKELNGLKIVQLSDVHIDKLKEPESYIYLVEKVNSLSPDIITITGDFNDLKTKSQLDKYVPVFRKLKAAYGVFAVPGNHEYYNNINIFLDFCQQADIRVLRNQNTLLAEGKFYLAGIDDPVSKDYSQGGADLTKTFEGIQRQKPVIFLSHRPYFFDEVSEKGFAVQLSGHTHNGQLPPVVLIVHFIYQYVAGLYTKNNSFLYVSSGTGYAGPPVRLFTSSEITEVILKSKEK